MKKSIKVTLIIFSSLIVVTLALYIALQPLRELSNYPSYKGATNFTWQHPAYDKTKKTVLVMADNNGTEMFDMLAPYYLFNATGKANVYVVAQNKYPIVMKKGPYILPHFTYSEIDSMKMHADVIVIPFMNEPDGAVKINWIKNHYTDSTIILSICDGAWTAAATGLYDGKLLTAHASDYVSIKEKFLKPVWIQNVSFTHSGKLFSTAGVSNATEGSLAVINALFGRETMLSVLKNVNYPHSEIEEEHKSDAINKNAILAGVIKVFFRHNKKIGVLLQDDISEIELAAIFDTYTRTLPSSIQSFIIGGKTVTTKYGLTLIATGDLQSSTIDEMYVMKSEADNRKNSLHDIKGEIISFNNMTGNYIIDTCLEKIKEEYGSKFMNLVKLSLDYN